MYFDIGANIGKWSLENINNCNKIISVEAVTETFNHLLSNCNNYNNIECLNYAVCNNNGNDIIFYKCSCDTLSTMNKSWLADPSSRFYNSTYSEIICKTITIDKLIENYGMPELIKIDVEGGEYNCIQSLTKKVPILCFEWASETNNITFDCLDYLNSLGFEHFFIQIEDTYSFRPNPDSYTNINQIKNSLLKMKPKIDWGMIWSK